MASEEPSGASGSQVRRNADQQTNISSSVAAGTGVQSDHSDFYALGTDRNAPSKMSESLIKFLYSRAPVPTEFISEFEKVSFSWNLQRFMQWFSTGTTFDIAVRFGVNFV